MLAELSHYTRSVTRRDIRLYIINSRSATIDYSSFICIQLYIILLRLLDTNKHTNVKAVVRALTDMVA